jgi:predicted DCC family thiol-disulfide oxidoreductase YuxK
MRPPYSYRGDPEVGAFPDDRPIIIFDGYCALCSGWAQFVLRHDARGVYRLVAAQTQLGRALYVHYGLDPQDYETNILIADGVATFKSEACIRMAEGLGPPWSLATIFRVLPPPWRDRLYGILARNRLRVFGRRATCYVPDRRHADHFLGTRNLADAQASLYRRLLGEAYATLSAPIQAMHDLKGPLTAEGRATVERGTNLLGRAIAAAIGFPPAGRDIPVKVDFALREGREIWGRDFDGRKFTSIQEEGRGRFDRLLSERFGPFRFGIALVCDQGRLQLAVRGWSLFGIPLPLWLAPIGVAHESGENGRFHFHVEIRLRLIGLIVRYEGWLAPRPMPTIMAGTR